MQFKIVIIIFYIISADQSIDNKSNNLWSVLFIITKYELFINQIQNINKLNFKNLKIIKIFEQIDDEINSWIQKSQHLAVIIWDHREKKEINTTFSNELVENLSKINKKINILCLDFCYSSNLELIINISDKADFIIANQDRQFMDGFYYDNVFNENLNHQILGKPTKYIAQEIVFQTCQHYIKTDQFNLINMVAIDCQKLKLIWPFIHKFEKLKFKSQDLFNLIEKNFYCSHLTQFLINNIIIAQAKTGNYQLSSGISI